MLNNAWKITRENKNSRFSMEKYSELEEHFLFICPFVYFLLHPRKFSIHPTLVISILEHFRYFYLFCGHMLLFKWHQLHVVLRTEFNSTVWGRLKKINQHAFKVRNDNYETFTRITNFMARVMKIIVALFGHNCIRK